MRNPQFVAFQSITNAVMQTVEAALQGDDEGTARPTFAGAAKARQAWKPVPDQIAAIEAAMVDLEDKVLSVSSNREFTEDAIASRITAADTKTRSTIAAAVDDVLRQAEGILTVVRDAGYPVRPDPHDEKQ